MLLRQFPPPYTTDTLIHAARALGFRIKLVRREAQALADATMPCLALLAPAPTAPVEGPSQDGNGAGELPPESAPARLALLTDVSPERILCFEAGTNTPSSCRPRPSHRAIWGSSSW